jgi:hypothetical protein
VNTDIDLVGPVDPVDLVDSIAVAVRACPAVAGLHGGRFGRATTYLPGRRVAGVAVFPGEVVIGVVGRYPASVSEIATQVRAAVAEAAGVAGAAPNVSVTVHVEDLLLPEEDGVGPASGPLPMPIASSRPVDSLPSPVPSATTAGPRSEEVAPIPTYSPSATSLP